MKISVVVPFFNEGEDVALVVEEIVRNLEQIHKDFEIIAVDDGSTDNTSAVLKSISASYPQLTVVTFPENRGKDAALFAAFHRASGDIIVTMDGDGQDDSADIPRMLALLKTHDAVFGRRAKRSDAWPKRLASRIAFASRRLLLADNVEDTACGLKAMKKWTLEYCLPIKGVHRFIPFLFKEAGISYAVMDVNHRARLHGKTKFSLLKFYFIPTVFDLLFMWWFKRRHLSDGLRMAEQKINQEKVDET